MDRQITTREIPIIRSEKSVKQQYRCPICSGSLAVGVSALDHDHQTGLLRSVLCGTCNRNEGKVLKAMVYMAKKTHPVWMNPVQWLRRLADYLEWHEQNPSELIHPTFDVVKGKQKPKKRARRKKV